MYSPLTSHDKRLPVGLSDCFTAGISGWCGGRCPVLKAGECPDQSEMASALDLPPCTGCGEQHNPSAECEAPSTRMDSPEMMR